MRNMVINKVLPPDNPNDLFKVVLREVGFHSQLTELTLTPQAAHDLYIMLKSYID